VVFGEPGTIDNAFGTTLSRGQFIDRPFINLQ
jgi:hypothetical protein